MPDEHDQRKIINDISDLKKAGVFDEFLGMEKEITNWVYEF